MFDKYISFLNGHPERAGAILLWVITMAFVYFVLLKYRKQMIEGSSGDNTFWEMPEQWGYLWMWVAAPITCYSAYFAAELPSWVWWFNSGVAAYTIGGRWIFQWVLALRSGSTTVQTEKTAVKIETETTHEKTTP